MIVLRNKIFSSNAQLKGNPIHVAEYQTLGLIREIIKLIEFYDKQHNMVHWVRQEIVGKYFRETLRSGHLITDCFATLYFFDLAPNNGTVPGSVQK